MKKTIVIVHGWDSSSKGDWFPWLQKECEKLGFETIVPDMPETETPEISKWVSRLKETVKSVDENTYFVGHSIACQTIMRFLAGQEKKVGGAVFVAPWFNVIKLESKEVEEVARPWIETPIDFNKLKKVLTKLTTIFSNNDPFVPFEESKKIFEEKLNPKIVVVHNAGHVIAADGFTEFPEALTELKSIIGI